MAGPLADVKYIHNAFRRDLASMARDVTFAATLDAGHLHEIGPRFEQFQDVLYEHEQSEEAILFPAVDAKVAGASEVLIRNHREMDQLRADLQAALDGLNAGKADDLMSQLVPMMSEHLDREEQEYVPLCEQHFTVEEQGQLAGAMSGHIPREKMPALATWLIKNLTLDDREGFVRMMMGAMPAPAFEGIKGIIKGALRENEWTELAARVPELDQAATA